MATSVRSERLAATERSSPAAATAELDYRPSYIAAGVVSLVVLVLYLLTLAPSTSMWDTSEYIAAAYVLGIPHPPGNPFFVLIGRVASLLPIGGSVAARINVLAALCSAVSAGLWFLVAERVLVSWLARRWQRIVGGAVAALIGATAFTVWNQSVVNEKVYTVSLLFFAIVSWLMVRWSDEPEGTRADRTLVLVAYLIGLGYANHPAGFLVAPAVAAAVLIRKPLTLLRWKLLLAGAAAFIVGLTPFVYQPIRAAHFPAINEGEPTACTNGPKVDCTLSKLTYDRLMANINRDQYGKPSLAERQAPFTAQVGMWWLYFKWQWLRDAHSELPGLQSGLAVLFLALGLVGGWVHWNRDRQSFWFFGPLVFTVTFALIYYMNFKYGASQAPELGNNVQREVRDRDYFYIWSFSTWGVWAALGLVWVWESIAALFGADKVKLGRQYVDQPRERSWLLASPTLALALIPLFGNWKQASRANQKDTAAFAKDLLNSVEPYGILVTVGDNDTFPLWYAQEVEGIRKDVIIANTSLLNTDWYTRQLVRRPVYEYDAAKGPAIYRGQTWPKPTKPPINLSMKELDAIPLGISLGQQNTFVKGVGADTIHATIQGQELYRADLLVLYMIRDAYPERPVYFSRTSGGYGQELGLQSYLLTQGLARKLLPTPPVPGKDTIMMQGEGWVDLKRTTDLWQSVFEGPKALIKRGDWVDMPSRGIPDLYTITGIELAEALARTGRPQVAQQVMATTQQLARAMHSERDFGLDRPIPNITGPGESPLPNLIPAAPTDSAALPGAKSGAPPPTKVAPPR
ncbi:Protein of unknown function DUF2723 [Gemmatirosa kalamazoonensis]|uniref:DUF2723 domain-containing protein n=1 Tax=Gemmatirosa kalamazoonensis TaxID=861299 RepID=W0RJK7_9BACT|nr:DUF2723 domain-containing protein [Gemmatirosa kalamazoonensis]AHG90525.1 Protein of unknown function DUF2723 [Gemmatirosa kalamazoonensis]